MGVLEVMLIIILIIVLSIVGISLLVIGIVRSQNKLWIGGSVLILASFIFTCFLISISINSYFDFIGNLIEKNHYKKNHDELESMLISDSLQFEDETYFFHSSFLLENKVQLYSSNVYLDGFLKEMNILVTSAQLDDSETIHFEVYSSIYFYSKIEFIALDDNMNLLFKNIQRVQFTPNTTMNIIFQQPDSIHAHPHHILLNSIPLQ